MSIKKLIKYEIKLIHVKDLIVLYKTKPSSQIKPKVRAACRHDLTQVDYTGPQPRVRSKLTICNGPLSSPNKKTNANGSATFGYYYSLALGRFNIF